jgi:outer membrane protein assembly factor BamB
VITANNNGTVMMMRKSDGQALWQVDLKTKLSTTPAISGTTVLVGTLTGKLIALNEHNGSVLWRATLPSSLLSAPAANGQYAIVHTHNGDLIAFNLATGKQAWLYTNTAPLLSLEGDSSPAISNDTVVCGFANGELAAFNVNNGKMLWERPVALPTGENTISNMVDVNGTPQIQNGVVYVGAYHGNVVSVSLKTGQLFWTHTMSTYQSVAVGPNNVYVSTSKSHVWALDQNTGKRVWVNEKLEARQISASVIYKGDVVVGDLKGYVHFLSLKDGHFVARVNVGSTPVLAAPVVENGVLYVMTQAGRVSAIQLK